MVDDMRPFKKGEYVVNKGGPNKGYQSTQRTRTVQTPEGKYINVNSLWKTHNGRTTTDIGHKGDDFIAATARRYEEKTQRYYPRHSTVEGAVREAVSRSEQGGSGSSIPLTIPLPRPKPKDKR